MRKPTVAECRAREIQKLVSFKTDHPTQADLDEARRLMNSFYRLCGLDERNLYLSNNERTCDLKSTQESEERAIKWHERLDAEFNRLYGLRLVYCGYMPSIGVICTPGGGFAEKISRYFYD